MKEVIRVLKTPLTMILLLAFVGYGAYWGYQHATAPTASRTATPCVMTDVGGELTTRSVTIRVLNGGDRNNLAKTMSLSLRAFGFTIARVNNTTEKVEKTVIVGPAEDDPQVSLLHGFFPDATVQVDGRTDGVIDVLLGNKTTDPNRDAPRSIPVSGPVCIAAPIAASATPSASGSPTKSASPSPSPSKSTKK
ncbi:MAG TPA: LytR C-terminal domain-containing protein [Propionicimonas sp.]|jgi:hypothetical protein|nr:LytR C-terminal domain-containing protein [Propionicimonas sp.]